jgi:hypothetical protein
MRVEEGLFRIKNEVEIAREKFPKFASYHEGLAVIQEEVFELQTLVYKSKPGQLQKEMKKEAIQIGAMALRYLIDLIGEDNN